MPEKRDHPSASPEMLVLIGRQTSRSPRKAEAEMGLRGSFAGCCAARSRAQLIGDPFVRPDSASSVEETDFLTRPLATKISTGVT
jgi:hypothetical protein